MQRDLIAAVLYVEVALSFVDAAALVGANTLTEETLACSPPQIAEMYGVVVPSHSSNIIAPKDGPG